MFGMRFEFLDACIGVPFERLGHYLTRLCRFGLGKVLGNISNLLNPAALHAGSIPAYLLNGRAQSFRSIDRPQIALSASFDL